MVLTELKYGFAYGPVTVTRTVSDKAKGWVALSVKTDKQELHVYVTKTGKVRVFTHPAGTEWHEQEASMTDPLDTGSSITCDAWVSLGTVKKVDIFQFTGVYSVNPLTCGETTPACLDCERLRSKRDAMAVEMNRALAEAEMAGHDADALQAERDALAKRWEELKAWAKLPFMARSTTFIAEKIRELEKEL